MAELDTSGGGGKKGGKVRSKKQSTRVDLTAMVDLAFLLVTFFMLTTTLNKPKAMDLAMPDKDEKQNKQEPIAASRTMTVLLGSNNKLEWFIGVPTEPLSPPTVTGYGKNGLREALIDQGKKIQASTGKKMFIIIKPSDKSVYKNMVDAIDEMHITNNDLYAIVDITKDEVALLQREHIY
jgi:biopolymer transport protein ExbD